eukprot:12897582-Prorocentrum_lima.AAC.1
MLVQGLVRSKLLVGASTWPELTNDMLEKITFIDNLAAKWSLGLKLHTEGWEQEYEMSLRKLKANSIQVELARRRVRVLLKVCCAEEEAAQAIKEDLKGSRWTQA